MSLYHETAGILSSPGGNLKTRIFSNRTLKSPQQQVYALALETCKWSPVLKEVVEKSDLLRHERKLTPLLALLLVHDLLLARKGIALPASHGLRTSVERHKARLTSEFTRSRLRREATSIDALRQLISVDFLAGAARNPRWVRVNTLKTTLQDQLDTTFKDFSRVSDVSAVTGSAGKYLHVDKHIPNLVAISPGFEITKTQAYVSGDLILQDKASCFPAYLLDPHVVDGDIIDSCAAPGNKTTHVTAIVKENHGSQGECTQRVYAFEKDRHRARTLEKMVALAGAKEIAQLSLGQDFLKVDPEAASYRNVGALLLDPSCSGSGIVGRDSMPTIHLPDQLNATNGTPSVDKSRKRKREGGSEDGKDQQVMVDDDGKETILSSHQERQARLESLSAFQLTLLLHAFTFPAARRLTYSTCSIDAEENEHVVLKALQSEVGRQRGWRILKRDQQVEGLRKWPVRGSLEASDGNVEIAEACIRSHQDDGLGVMGFFVAGFVRDLGEETAATHAPRVSNGSADANPTTKRRNVHKDSGQDHTGTEDEFTEEDSEEWGGFDD